LGQVSVTPEEIAPVPSHLGQTISPVPSQFGHTTCLAKTSPRDDKNSIPIKVTVKILRFILSHIPVAYSNAILHVGYCGGLLIKFRKKQATANWAYFYYDEQAKSRRLTEDFK
jgi:hypothetical protein